MSSRNKLAEKFGVNFYTNIHYCLNWSKSMKFLLGLLGMLATTVYAGEIIKFDAFDIKHKKTSVVISEVFLPQNIGTSKVPVIITQHGSSPFEAFENGPGHTDIFSKEVVRQGLKEGYAVATIDAFYGRNLSPSAKSEFPNATPWAYKLKEILSNDPRFDSTRFFYTGYSYGGDVVMNSMLRVFIGQNQWRAIAPAEAGCGIQPSARLLPFPVLFIKGADSHYPPSPCIYLSEKLKESGSASDVIVIEKANHSFSSYGVGVRSGGVAINGCTDNPVIRTSGGLIHADGSALKKDNPLDECKTNTSGGGGYPDKLGIAVGFILSFFNQHR